MLFSEAWEKMIHEKPEAKFCDTVPLKGPKLEIFVAGIFT
jgi:hypothetical protein